MRQLVVVLSLWLVACGPSAAAKRAQTLIDRGDYAGAGELAAAELEKHPKDPDLWRVRIRAALGQHDARAAVAHYRSWRDLRGAEDGQAMRMMALTTIWQALESPSAPTRVEAIRAIERLEIERLADAVADHLGDEDDAAAAAAAIAILRAYPQAPEVATAMLQSHDPVARAIAVEGIGRKIGGRAAHDLRPLADDPDPRVRRAAVRALAAIGDARDTDKLVALAKDADAEVRAAALGALARGARGDHAALARAALADEHLGVRLAAVALLDASGDRATLASLLGGADLAVASHAARELARVTPAEAAAALERALASDDWSIRAGALNLATSVLGAERARARAAQLLEDPSLDVRLAAARLLGDDPRAIAVFVAALADPQVGVWAAADLARLDDPRGVAALEQAAAADEGRRAAVLAHRAARRATFGLVAALADADPLVRVAAAEAILELVPVD